MDFFKEDRGKAITALKISIELIRKNFLLLIISFAFAIPFVLLEALSLLRVFGYVETLIFHSIISLVAISYLSGGFIGVINELLNERKIGLDKFNSISKKFFLKILIAQFFVLLLSFLGSWILDAPQKIQLDNKIFDPVIFVIGLVSSLIGLALIVLFMFVDQFIVLERRGIWDSLKNSAEFVYKKKKVVLWFYIISLGLYIVERILGVFFIAPFTSRILPLFFIKNPKIQLSFFILLRQVILTLFLALRQTYPTVLFIQNQD
jgi:hypothetical protein